MSFDRWRVLPFGVLISCAIVSLNIVVFGPSFVDHPYSGSGQAGDARSAEASAEGVAGCSGALAEDYACYRELYRNLVLDEGVNKAFVELRADYEEGGFVRANCHQMTHVLGRAAVERFGDVSGAYARGNGFCWSGYYHGAMEAVVARVGPEKIMQQAGGICADLGAGQRRYSFDHYNCVHGLGHGFMLVRGNDLFSSLATCDTLLDAWERDGCYGGVFMENVISAGNDPQRPATEFLDPERPLYPCTDLAYAYKDQCYGIQTSYALDAVRDDFARVFDLCDGVEADFLATCYGGIGRDAVGRGNYDPARIQAACDLGSTFFARSGCVNGAAVTFVSYYDSDTQAKDLCARMDPSLRPACLQATAAHSATL